MKCEELQASTGECNLNSHTGISVCAYVVRTCYHESFVKKELHIEFYYGSYVTIDPDPLN